MLTIAFDGACFGDGPTTGVGRAFATGLAAYAARGDADCVLLLPANASDPAIAGVRTVKAPRGALRRQLQLPHLLRTLRADLLHSSVAAVPLRAPCPTVATVHDLPWLHDELRAPDVGERTSRWRIFATVRALRSAAAVLAPSQFTARDARIAMQRRDARLVVVPHGTTLGPAPTDAAIDARSEPFLVLGDDRPRKNRARLVAAWQRALLVRPSLPPLRFVGPPDGYVDEVEKVRLLASCRALVHVSRFEGFGLPVLEGLAHGAPVLCSDLPPHREIAGEHAEFVPPTDVDAIAAGLVRLDRDRDRRRALAHGGHARARAFAPEAVADAWHRLHTELAR
jgi:glycosyltransferase involved in cell wall biosynthesis